MSFLFKDKLSKQAFFISCFYSILVFSFLFFFLPSIPLKKFNIGCLVLLLPFFSFFLHSFFYLSYLLVFVARPTKRASTAQGLFLGGSGCMAGAHMCPAFSKNTYGPVYIPLRRQAIPPPKRVKAWVGP